MISTISFVFPYGLVAAGALFFLLSSSRASRKMPRSPRLAHKTPVMQATVLLHSRKQSAPVTGTFFASRGCPRHEIFHCSICFTSKSTPPIRIRQELFSATKTIESRLRVFVLRQLILSWCVSLSSQDTLFLFSSLVNNKVSTYGSHFTQVHQILSGVKLSSPFSAKSGVNCNYKYQ